MDKTRNELLIKLQLDLHYTFLNSTYLDCALTHSSYRHEAKKTGLANDNERLEFLGDAVLNFVISNHLYHLFPELPEGRLARLKAVVVSEPILCARGKALQLGKYLLLGRGEIKSGGADRSSIIGNAFEAVIGAIFLDGGIISSQKFILEQLAMDIESIAREPYMQDHKSVLQEFVQAHYLTIPVYQLMSESGPDHDKRFIVKVFIKGDEFGLGEGKSKKEAEQKAAEQACIKLKVLKPTFSIST